jgi:hypothetical protein
MAARPSWHSLTPKAETDYGGRKVWRRDRDCVIGRDGSNRRMSHARDGELFVDSTLWLKMRTRRGVGPAVAWVVILGAPTLHDHLVSAFADIYLASE